MEERYPLNGFATRGDYIAFLSEQNNIAEDVIWSLAELLGPSEDFDGLLISLSDFKDVPSAMRRGHA